ncbi:MAG TPA: FecR family protein [Verrucomicrobiae bacterium]|jgi:hypothetical protein
MKTTTLLALLAAGSATLLAAAPLTESTFTEIVRDVKVVAGDQSGQPAKLNGLVRAPERVRTSADSRAELTAPDQTLTRIGANTVFSFDTAGRTINLEQGSLLFHSPKGAGGGTIKSGGASAAVSGTTLIVVATPYGGFKVIILEGRARVKLARGRSVSLNAGQTVYLINDGRDFSPVFDIDLAKLIEGSLLVRGFPKPLPSVAQIDAALVEQQQARARGRGGEAASRAEAFAATKLIGLVDEIEMSAAVGGGVGRAGQ